MSDFLYPMECSPPDSSVHGILHTRILEWVPRPSSKGSSQPRDELASLMSPALAGRFFTISTTWEVVLELGSPVRMLCGKPDFSTTGLSEPQDSVKGDFVL